MPTVTDDPEKPLATAPDGTANDGPRPPGQGVATTTTTVTGRAVDLDDHPVDERAVHWPFGDGRDAELPATTAACDMVPPMSVTDGGGVPEQRRGAKVR